MEGVEDMKHLNDLGVRDILWKKWDMIIDSIESAFIDPTADMVPKVYLDGRGGDFRAMPAALRQYAALKWIGVFPDNRQVDTPKNIGVGLPTTLGTLILSDRSTGYSLMSMDCTALTAFRTAATSAIAAKYCAPNNIKEIALIGCGKQAFYHYHAYNHIFYDIETVHLYDKNYSQNDYHDFAEKCMVTRIDSKTRKFLFHENVKDAVKDAELITTLTPSTEGYLDIFDVPNNCHINAVGADAKGKRELMTNVIDGSTNIICDDPMQALHSGELQYNEWPKLDITSLKNLILDNKSMELDNGVSLFDSTGVAIEDIALAIMVYDEYSEEILGS
jgi:alanine dehydrogenase|tara:strand:+ start:2532 stop:3527 length:996 start_codon:yes stop_codon:yes gene_type:complete